MIRILSGKHSRLFRVIAPVDFKRPQVQSEPDRGISFIDAGRQGQNGGKLILDTRMGVKPERVSGVIQVIGHVVVVDIHEETSESDIRVETHAGIDELGERAGLAKGSRSDIFDRSADRGIQGQVEMIDGSDISKNSQPVGEVGIDGGLEVGGLGDRQLGNIDEHLVETHQGSADLEMMIEESHGSRNDDTGVRQGGERRQIAGCRHGAGNPEDLVVRQKSDGKIMCRVVGVIPDTGIERLVGDRVEGVDERCVLGGSGELVVALDIVVEGEKPGIRGVRGNVQDLEGRVLDVVESRRVVKDGVFVVRHGGKGSPHPERHHPLIQERKLLKKGSPGDSAGAAGKGSGRTGQEQDGKNQDKGTWKKRRAMDLHEDVSGYMYAMLVKKCSMFV